MLTTDYRKPSKEEFRITKTDCKKAIKAILTGSFKLTHSFQDTLDYIYSTIRFLSVSRWYEEVDGSQVHRSSLFTYEISHIEVKFHKVLAVRSTPAVFATNYQNTTSDDFTYTLMNTFIPIMLEQNMLVR